MFENGRWVAAGITSTFEVTRRGTLAVILFSKNGVHDDSPEQRQEPDQPELSEFLIAKIEIRSPNAPTHPHLKGKKQYEEDDRHDRHGW